MKEAISRSNHGNMSEEFIGEQEEVYGMKNKLKKQ